MNRCLLERPPDETVLPLVGLEVDNLLSFLALLGLLRAIERAAPTWSPRVSWTGPRWRAHLHLAERADEAAVAVAARAGLDAIVMRYDVDARADVNFKNGEYRMYLECVRDRDLERFPEGERDYATALATALSAELPRKASGDSQASPLVMMFGQGHQHFLDRLVYVPRGEVPTKLRKLKYPPNLRDPRWLERALFEPWVRADATDGFRWDPEDDQRYALRATNPSDDGAARTVHGANQLAAVGILSFTSFPCGGRWPKTRGVVRSRDAPNYVFVWPVWSEPLGRYAVEHLLGHEDVLAGRLPAVRALGVLEIFAARRIPNGKYMNVARARPMIHADMNR